MPSLSVCGHTLAAVVDFLHARATCRCRLVSPSLPLSRRTIVTRSMPRAGGGHDDHPHVSQPFLLSFVGGGGPTGGGGVWALEVDDGKLQGISCSPWMGGGRGLAWSHLRFAVACCKKVCFRPCVPYGPLDRRPQIAVPVGFSPRKAGGRGGI